MTSAPTLSRLDRFGLRRRPGDRMLSGLAAGIAHRLGIAPVYVRAGFITLAFVWGIGVLLYLAGLAATLDDEAPASGETREASIGQRVGLASLFTGALLVVRGVGLWPGDELVWPVAAVAFGAAFVLDHGDIDSRAAFLRLLDPDNPGTRRRTVAGLLLAVFGVALLTAGAVPGLGVAGLAVVVTGAGLTLLFGPWVWRLAEELGSERRERIRQEERAEMAAHLHDSVLQTLALIQRSDDPRRMVTLARAQERELRRWLYERAPAPRGDQLSAALQAAADRVEADFDVRVEVVSVGDLALDERLTALVAAAGEALTNAAKHAGVERISLYSEVGEEAVEVWVSDQGKGFDPEAVAFDRRGIADSLVGRMHRYGGSAAITSETGEGTEVHLSIQRSGT